MKFNQKQLILIESFLLQDGEKTLQSFLIYISRCSATTPIEEYFQDDQPKNIVPFDEQDTEIESGSDETSRDWSMW
jgi:hypothetical protein